MLLDFKTPRLSDKQWVDELLRLSRHRGCLYSFGQFYLWSLYYGTKICRFGDCIMILAGRRGINYYCYPAGKYDVRAVVGALERDSAERGVALQFFVVEEWQADELEAAFPGRFVREETREDFDYIYNSRDLIELAGRKYHGKRNHISRFTRLHPDWRYEPINDGNENECMEAAQLWAQDPKKSGDDDLLVEHKIIDKALREREAIGLKGGLIRANGKVVAFTLGERLNDDSFVLHFEKALPGYEEAYTVINREFAAHELSSYRYINREEDLGLEGLRKAKLSYHPEILLKKYIIRER